VALLKDHHTVIDPTLDAFEDLLTAEQGKVTAGLEPMVGRLPVQTQRWFLTGGLPLEGDKLKTYRASYDKLLAMVKLLHDAHVAVVAGTDSLDGLMLHHELALYVRAGITPADAIKMDTIEAARVMKLDAKTGSITAGKAADLFVVEGDPLAHIEELGNVVSTMRAGVVFPSAPLYESVGVKERQR
jgi:imidazolonepropionase-like amidohydrolase